LRAQQWWENPNFVLNFVAMATTVGRGKIQLAAFDGPIAKTFYRHKNLAEISYASRVIANSVPNFVAMATGVGREEMRLMAFDGASPKNPRRRKKSRQNLLRKPSHSQFRPKFRCHGNGGRSRKNWDWRHSMAHSQTPPPYRRKNIDLNAQYISNLLKVRLMLVKPPCGCWRSIRCE